MKKLLWVFGIAALLSACAAPATDSQADAKAHAACRDVDPPVGSHMVKRADCGVSSASNPDGVRRDAEILQQQQTIRVLRTNRQP